MVRFRRLSLLLFFFFASLPSADQIWHDYDVDIAPDVADRLTFAGANPHAPNLYSVLHASGEQRASISFVPRSVLNDERFPSRLQGLLSQISGQSVYQPFRGSYVSEHNVRFDLFGLSGPQADVIIAITGKIGSTGIELTAYQPPSEKSALLAYVHQLCDALSSRRLAYEQLLLQIFLAIGFLWVGRLMYLLWRQRASAR